MTDSEYLEYLFKEYVKSLDALNNISTSFYSRDEYKLRHRVFKQIFAKYRAYKLKLFIDNLKNKLFNFKLNMKIKRKNKIINNYNKLKEDGEI